MTICLLKTYPTHMFKKNKVHRQIIKKTNSLQCFDYMLTGAPDVKEK